MAAHDRPGVTRVPMPEDADARCKEDEERVRRALGGDSKAFEELYTKYRPARLQGGLQRRRNVEDALDVTQETFLKAHRSLELFEGRASVLTWLCQIAIHRAIDLERRKKVRRAVGLEDYMTPAGGRRSSSSGMRPGATALDPDATPSIPVRAQSPARPGQARADARARPGPERGRERAQDGPRQGALRALAEAPGRVFSSTRSRVSRTARSPTASRSRSERSCRASSTRERTSRGSCGVRELTHECDPMSTAMDCPVFLSIVSGEREDDLTPEESIAFETHLDSCSSCREAVARAEEDLERLSVLADPPPARGRRVVARRRRRASRGAHATRSRGSLPGRGPEGPGADPEARSDDCRPCRPGGGASASPPPPGSRS